VINRELLELIENNGESGGVSAHSTSLSIQPSTFGEFKNISSKKRNEIISDRSEYGVIVIDNSSSMLALDGTICIQSTNNIGKITIIDGVTRWQEATKKTVAIAKYNIHRKFPCIYYLLNPENGRDWLINIDFVIIDPNKEDYDNNLKILISFMLNRGNIRGNTPLDKITNNVRTSLHLFMNESNYKTTPICYNIITDGKPNSKYLFEKELRFLANNYNIFLTINLCTNDNGIIEYYNNLDKTIGNELGGLDVIDDFKGEQLEIINAGNNFITYSYDIHLCRMAGCNSVVADLLDEETLSVYHANKLVKELLNNPKNLPHWTNRVEYINKVSELNKPVYNLYYNKNTSIINTTRLNWMIWKYQQQKKVTEFYKYNQFIIITIIVVFIGIWSMVTLI